MKTKECPDCEGQGRNYVDTSRQCTKVLSECCGGCGYDEDCETCETTGKIEDDEEES